MRIAILIPGQLRCLKVNRVKFQNNLINENYDVFVYTNKSYGKFIKYIKNCRVVKYVEDNKDDINSEKKISQGRRPRNLYQWFKYKRCFQIMEEYCKENNIKYDIICKLRTDYTFCSKIILNKDVKNEMLYMESDRFFYGNYETMKVVSDFFDIIYDKYFGTQKIYHPINYDALLRSDIGSGKYNLFYYPRSIVGKPKNINELRNIISKNLSKLKKYEYTPGDPLYAALHSRKPFQSEKNFFHYILSQNIIGKRCQTPGTIRLDRRSSHNQ